MSLEKTKKAISDYYGLVAAGVLVTVMGVHTCKGTAIGHSWPGKADEPAMVPEEPAKNPRYDENGRDLLVEGVSGKSPLKDGPIRLKDSVITVNQMIQMKNEIRAREGLPPIPNGIKGPDGTFRSYDEIFEQAAGRGMSESAIKAKVKELTGYDLSSPELGK